MKAIVQNTYGRPGTFTLAEIDKPTLRTDDDVLVRTHTAALHAGDLFVMRGVPYPVRLFAGWPRPRNYVPGFDVAGYVEAVGRKVTNLHPGDEVFGACTGTCAEFVRTEGTNLRLKPTNLTLEQSAAVPTSALAALIGLRDAGKVKPGQKVLINGASGGVGTFAVQIAKALGAEVTGVCSGRNVELVRSLGADHVIDYTRADFTQGEERYDLILDQVANHPLSECRRALTPRGKHLPNSGNGGMGYVIRAFAESLFVRQQARPFTTPNTDGLAFLKELIEAGKVRPVIDRTYPLSQTEEAFRYLDQGHARGKVVIAVGVAGEHARSGE